MYSSLEQELETLEEAFADGRISRTQLNREYNQIMRTYRDAACEAAEDAYDQELGNW